jgi:16S rRNA (cytosine967-C5)-methyltransferase
MTPAARLASAIELLAAIEATPRRPADATANDFFRSRRYIGSGDRRAVSERAWYVLRNYYRLRWWLEKHQAPITARLLTAASLMFEGWQFSGIDQAFSGGQFGAMRLIDTETRVLRALEGHTLDHPAMPDDVRMELPAWIFERFAARFGADLAQEMAALRNAAPLDLRVNLLQTTREAARAVLAAETIDCEDTKLSPFGLRIPSRRPVTAGAAFQAGLVEIQDEGSQLVALVCDVAPGMRVLDWCAGAGGKTLALAMLMQNKGFIVAADVSVPRLDGAVRRLRRAGVHNVERHLSGSDAKWVKRRAQSFDRVLVDAPCTGTGTWRRNPDARLRLRETDLAELIVKQADILETAKAFVKPGGRLIYATCSLLAEENTGQIDKFLAANPDFSVLPIENIDACGAFANPQNPYLSLSPASHGTDGFFSAVLTRKAAILPPAGRAPPLHPAGG